MATIKTSTVSRFHNLTDEALADAIGRADAIVKGAEAELATLKDEFKARGLSDVTGDEFTVTATEQISGRIDIKPIKELLGARYGAFEKVIISTAIRIKAANRFALGLSEAAAVQRSCRHSPETWGRAVALSPNLTRLRGLGQKRRSGVC